MSKERKPDIDFPTLFEIVETAFRERYLNALVETLAVLASHYEYYFKVNVEDVIMAYYDYSFEYNSPPRDVYVTFVLKTGIAVKVLVEKEKESDKIARAKVWVVPVE